MIETPTPTLWEIRLALGHEAAVAIIVNALIHAARLVSLEHNITIEQIGEAANDILASFGYFKVEEVKYLLKRALRSQNLYGRFDYNVIMNWVEAYDAERTDEAMRLSDQQETRLENESRPHPEAMDFTTYVEKLRQKAPSDPEAAAMLAQIENPDKPRLTLLSREERLRREHDFKMWYTFKYLQGKE